MPQYTDLEEQLAIELHSEFMTAEEYKAIFGLEKDTWEDCAEFNRDDYRAQARICLNFLKERGLLK